MYFRHEIRRGLLHVGAAARAQAVERFVSVNHVWPLKRVDACATLVIFQSPDGPDPGGDDSEYYHENPGNNQ